MSTGLKQHFVLSFLIAVLAGCSQPRAFAQTPATDYRVVEVAHGLEVPWSLAFAPDGRILVTERPGRLRVIADGKLQAKPLFVFPAISSRSEEGLMGLVLHPDFARNHLLYVSYATKRNGNMVVDVVRYRETGTTLVEPKTIVADLPASQNHAGCKLKFGPDRKLYITTGDATQRDLAQRLDSLAGKILRVNDDGSIPADNPWPHSPLWIIGSRNSQGIDWDPVSGMLFEVEHGPSGFDGPGGGDEVNIIERGANYGWPIIHHRAAQEGLKSPLLEYTPALAPSGAAFYRGHAIPKFENNFFFAALRGEQLHRVVLDPKDRRKVVREEKLLTNYGRLREVIMGPDGALYVTTSNRDGRGSAQEMDDRIMKLVPR